MGVQEEAPTARAGNLGLDREVLDPAVPGEDLDQPGLELGPDPPVAHDLDQGLALRLRGGEAEGRVERLVRPAEAELAVEDE